MHGSLTKRLSSEEGADSDFAKKIRDLVSNYVGYATQILDYWSPEYDVAHDTVMCWASLSRKDFADLHKGRPRRFILPITATHIHTMTTFLTTALFGTDSAHRVNAGGPEDEGAARVMNELLKWNGQQQQAGMFQLGWSWVEASLIYNRGVLYDFYDTITRERWAEVEEPVMDDDGNQQFDEFGNPEFKTVKRKLKEPVGTYCKIETVSPYDFYVDPQMPLHRFQEGRFAGHRTNSTWNSLKNRSEKDPEDPCYLNPHAVDRLKESKGKNKGFATSPQSINRDGSDIMSRTAYERGRSFGPQDSKADTKDAGMISVVELWVRLVPKDYDIDDRDTPEIFQIVVGNDKEVLAVNESTYEHGMFPYSVGEARPSAFYQHSPSWVMVLKSLQDYVDYLKNRHQEAITRTVGNIFIAKPWLVDIRDFEDPDKEGKFINILPEAASTPINDIVKQVEINDVTAGFLQEMRGFIQISESTSGANQSLQGQLAQDDVTATEFAGTMQMATGRLNAIARLLSVQGMVPQTKRIVSNFQQFYDDNLVRRVVGEGLLDITYGEPEVIEITRDSIQGTFDFIPHDGTLPGSDNRKVAAMKAAIELMPQFPQLFTPAPGNLDPKPIFIDFFRAAGMNVERYRYRDDKVAEAQAQQQQAMQQMMMAQAMAGGPRGPDPNNPAVNDLSLASAAPPQARPQNSST